MSVISKPPLGRRINYAHPLAYGLVRTYLLNENAAATCISALEMSSNGTGVEQAAIEGAPVPNGRGLTFDGVDDAVLWAESGLGVDPPEYSLVARVRFTTAATINIMFGHGNSGTGNTMTWLATGGTAGTIRFNCRNVFGISIDAESLSTYNDGRDHTAVGTLVNGGAQNLYVDGVLVATASAPSLSGTTFNRTSIGALRRVTTGAFGASSVDCALVYNRALTQAEALALHLDPYAMVRRRLSAPFSNVLILIVRPDQTEVIGSYTASGAATLHEALNDESDSTYIVSTSGGTTRVIELLQGATVRATRTLAPGPSFTEESFTLTAPELASITSWSDIRVRITDGGTPTVLGFPPMETPTGDVIIKLNTKVQ
jgi:hypothetical protein